MRDMQFVHGKIKEKTKVPSALKGAVHGVQSIRKMTKSGPSDPRTPAARKKSKPGKSGTKAPKSAAKQKFQNVGARIGIMNRVATTDSKPISKMESYLFTFQKLCLANRLPLLSDISPEWKHFEGLVFNYSTRNPLGPTFSVGVKDEVGGGACAKCLHTRCAPPRSSPRRWRQTLRAPPRAHSPPVTARTKGLQYRRHC